MTTAQQLPPLHYTRSGGSSSNNSRRRRSRTSVLPLHRNDMHCFSRFSSRHNVGTRSGRGALSCGGSSPAACCCSASQLPHEQQKEQEQRQIALDLCGQRVVVLGLGASGRGAAALELLRGATAVVGMDLSLEALPLEEDPHVTCFLANTQDGNTSGSSDSDVLAEGDSFEGRRRLSTQLGPHQEELVQHADGSSSVRTVSPVHATVSK